MKNKIVNRICGDGNGLKTIWRISDGNKEKAYLFIRAIMKHYNLFPDDLEIDNALADVNGGCEVEWNS